MNMKTDATMYHRWIIGIVWVYGCLQVALADLTVRVAELKRTGDKAVIKLEMKNSFAVKIESARVVVFLMDDKGKVVDQVTRWVVGGEKDRPALLPDAKATYNFVVSTEKPFSTTKISFTRVVLEGGKLADIKSSVTVTPISK